MILLTPQDHLFDQRFRIVIFVSPAEVLGLLRERVLLDQAHDQRAEIGVAISLGSYHARPQTLDTQCPQALFLKHGQKEQGPAGQNNLPGGAGPREERQ